MKKMFFKRFLRILASVMILVLCTTVANVLSVHNTEILSVNTDSFYNEPLDSLDYVVIGSSATLENIFPSVIYEETKITGNNISSYGADSRIYKSMLREIVCTQPNALIIVDIDGFTQDFGNERVPINIWIDSMNHNENWKETINELDKEYWFEHYFPIIRYHKMLMSPGNVYYAIRAVIEYDINRTTNCFKGSNSSGNTIRIRKNEIENFVCLENFISQPIELDEGQENVLYEFLEICQELKIKNVLFIDCPKGYGNIKKYEQLANRENRTNYCSKIINSYGFEVLCYSELDNPISLKRDDFLDSYHLTEKGAIKFSKYLANYLSENYIFSDKTRDIMDSWENSTAIAYKKYNM
ncbi:MAG: hypothetical protein ACI37Z_07895 [Candidatus Gastranaerophilaceae bacterium]